MHTKDSKYFAICKSPCGMFHHCTEVYVGDPKYVPAIGSVFYDHSGFDWIVCQLVKLDTDSEGDVTSIEKAYR